MKRLVFAAVLGMLMSASLFAAGPVGESPRVVVSTKKIWIVADERPVKHLLVEVIDVKGRVVLSKDLSSKVADWSLSVKELPAGKYSVRVDGVVVERFKL